MRRRVVGIVFGLLSGCVQTGPVAGDPHGVAPLPPTLSERAQQMSVAEARLTVARLLATAYRATGGEYLYGWTFTSNARNQKPLQDVKVTKDALSLVDRGDLSSGLKIKGEYSVSHRIVFAEAPAHVSLAESDFVHAGSSSSSPMKKVFIAQIGEAGPQNPFKWVNRADAELFADAFSKLVDVAKNPAPEDGATFAAKSEAWRATSPRPPLPPDADRERVLAENAFREKRPEVAFSHFERGLAIEPCWPDGNFNAALLAGELGVYEDALRYMRRYLLLVPDSRDAAAAREKIIVWEDKLASHEE